MFKFKKFTVENQRAALKVGTDGVLLGSLMTIPPGVHRALDIGTGTGVVALLCAQRLADGPTSDWQPCEGPADSGWSVDAVEIDQASAQEASDNFRMSPWGGHLHAIHCPLSAYAPDAGTDLIFSNPPYYDSSLPNSDGRMATARHTQSLSYREVCSFAASKLNVDGRLSIILPSECERELLRCAGSFGLYPYRIVRIKTVEKKPVRRIVAEFSFKKLRTKEESLTLESEQGLHVLDCLDHVTF